MLFRSQKINEYIDGRIDSLRRRNDGDLSERETSHLRGRIAELRNLLAQVAKPERADIEHDDP